jgi:ribosome assembly protein SQT1
MYLDPRSPDPIFKLTPPDTNFNVDGITALAINPACTLAVIGGAGGGIRVISLTKGEVVSILGNHSDGESVESAVFINLVEAAEGSDASTVVTGGTDGRVCVWDLKTLRLRASFEHLVRSTFNYMCIISLIYLIQDAVTLLLLHPTKPHLIVSGSMDGTLRTWDARACKTVREHKGHHGPVLGAVLGNNGALVVSGADDSLCLVYNTE